MNFGNIGAAFKAKKVWETVSNNHPKIEGFIQDMRSSGIVENMEIAVAVRYPDGTEHKAGIRLTASDIEALSSLKGLDL